MKYLLAALLVLVAGCLPARSVHDATRAGVVSLAGAARIVYMKCAFEVTEAASTPDLSEEQIVKAVRLASVCDAGLKTAKEELEEGAHAVDAGRDAEAACNVARATGALASVVDELVSYGSRVTWEIHQAVKIGEAAGAFCR